MRATEFIHFLNRTDIGLGQNPPKRDYTHFTPKMYSKRLRYEHQLKLREDKNDL